MKYAWTALVFAACAMAPKLGPPENLALGAYASDVAEYPLLRVGVLPCTGRDFDESQSRELQELFAAEIARRASFEVVIVGAQELVDLSGGRSTTPFSADSDQIVALARRHDLDALFFLRAWDRQLFTPQRLALQVDLVACDTGSTLWTARGSWNSADSRVRTSIEAWFAADRATGADDENWDLYLLAPRRFAAYACAQVADRFAPLPPQPIAPKGLFAD